MDRVAGTSGGVNVPPSIAAIAFSVSLVMWGKGTKQSILEPRKPAAHQISRSSSS